MKILLPFNARSVVLVAVAALLCLSGPGKAAEGDTPYFSFHEIEFAGSHHSRLILDIDGDGLKDLGLVVSRSNKRDDYLFRLCIQQKSGDFTCRDSEFMAGARAYDVGEINGQPGAEMVVITDKDVKSASLSGGKLGSFKQALASPSVLANTEPDKPALLRFLWDLDGDGKSEMVLPTVAGPAIHKFGEAGFERSQIINSPAFITYRVGSLGDISATDDVNQFLRFREYEQRVTAHYTSPDLFVTDANGDKRLDVVTLVDNTLRVFLQGVDGRFSEKPDAEEKRSILPPEERSVGFSGEAMTFSDLDKDGVIDIIMMKWGSTQERTQMDRYIYFGRPGLKFPADPDQIVRSESAALDFGIYDLNRDDKLDLIIPFFHFAPAQAFKVMTENAIKVQFRIFLMGPNGRYSQDPGKTFAKVDRRIQLNYKIDILGMIFDIRSLLEGKFHPLIAFGYDLNGDGYPDLAADTGADRLEFYWGNKEVNYARQPDHQIDLESCMDYELDDLNKDGKIDIITFYESKERTQKRRELAQTARQKGAATAGEYELEESSELAKIPEGTRVKFLISK